MTTTATRYPHLSDDARAVIDLSARERLEWFEAQEVWIPYPEANAILREIDELIRKPRRHRMPGRLVISDSNNGKTRLALQCLAEHPVDANPEGEHVRAPVIYLELPAKPVEAAILDMLLIALSQPFRQKDSSTERRDQLIKMLRRCGVRVLLVDEIQRMLGAQYATRRVLMDALRYISNQVPVPIVAFSTKPGANALASSEEMINRMHPLVLPAWNLDKAFRALVADFEELLPLREPSKLTTAKVTSLLHVKSGGLLGELRDFLELGLATALGAEAESLSLEMLEGLRWTAPADRKRLIGAPGKSG